MSDAPASAVYTADRYGFIGFGVLFGFLIAATLAMAIADGGGEAVYILVFLVVVAIFVFMWLKSFRLVVSDKQLTYTTLFAKRSIETSDIRKVVFDPAHFGTLFGPTVRLTVSFQTQNVPDLVINAKVFSREAIRHVQSLQNHRG